MSALFSFNTLIILGIVISAVLAVVFEKPLSSVIALGITGGFTALEFIVYFGALFFELLIALCGDVRKPI